MIATVTSKGRVTIPIALREKLGIGAGTKLDFSLHTDGRLEVVIMQGKLADLRGILPKPDRTLSLEEMDALLTGESS